jgi:hypothetical protein
MVNEEEVWLEAQIASVVRITAELVDLPSHNVHSLWNVDLLASAEFCHLPGAEHSCSEQLLQGGSKGQRKEVRGES